MKDTRSRLKAAKQQNSKTAKQQNSKTAKQRGQPARVALFLVMVGYFLLFAETLDFAITFGLVV
jgi:hypothetical protein